MKKNYLICFLLVTMMAFFECTQKTNAQTPDFVPYDEYYTGIIKFHKTDTILVIVPETYSLSGQDSSDIEGFVFWDEKPKYLYKRESEFNKNDMKRHIQMYGPYKEFHNSILMKIPVKQNVAGFEFRGRIFDQPDNAFFYLNDSATMLYTCRNSNMIYNLYRNFAAGAYQLYIFEGNEIIYTGFSSDCTNKENINDMDEKRAEYFLTKQTKYFNFQVARSLNCDSIFNIAEKEMDDYVDQLCYYLEVDNENIDRIKTYFYSDRHELQLFIAAPEWMTIYGKSLGSINHVSGFALDIFKHETGHSIIGKKLGVNKYDFFMEGFRQYTDYFFSETTYKNDLEIAKANIDLLTPNLVRCETSVFFRNMNHYQISGVFTKFIIDKMGLEAFKKAYTNNSIEEDLLTITGYSLEKLIESFIDNI